MGFVVSSFRLSLAHTISFSSHDALTAYMIKWHSALGHKSKIWQTELIEPTLIFSIEMNTNINNRYGIESLFERISQRSVREWWMGVAMILVIMHHFCIWHNHTKYFFLVESIFIKGDIGVNIFLFFSAFGLCFSYKSNSLSHFYYKRAIRIIPLYILALLIVCYLPPPILC